MLLISIIFLLPYCFKSLTLLWFSWRVSWSKWISSLMLIILVSAAFALSSVVLCFTLHVLNSSCIKSWLSLIASWLASSALIAAWVLDLKESRSFFKSFYWIFISCKLFAICLTLGVFLFNLLLRSKMVSNNLLFVIFSSWFVVLPILYI